MSTNIDFDELCKLYKTDPEAFERRRQHEINKFIESSPSKSQKRLRGLQFQVDAKRTIYKDKPYMSCMEISKMMHARFNDLNDQLNSLFKSDHYPKHRQEQTAYVSETTAKVVEFRK